jgi:tetratricopeptide (TPR) repeat protein
MIANIYKYLIVFLLLFCNSQVFAQSPEIDSLNKLLGKTKSDKEIKRIEAQLSKEYIFIEPIKTLTYTKSLIPYFIKAKDTSILLNLYNTQGIANAITGNSKESEESFLEKLRLARLTGDSVTVAGTYSSLGNVYQNNGDYPKALKYFKLSIKIFKAEKNDKGLSTAYTNIGNTYKSYGQLQNSLDAYFKSLKISEKLKQNTGTVLSNIGNAFADMDEYEKAKKYYLLSIEQFKKEGSDYYVSWGYSNLASIYLDNDELDKAEELYSKAMKMHEKQGDLEGIAHTEHSIGLIRTEQERFDEAIAMYQSSLKHYDELEMPFEVAKNLVDMGVLERRRNNQEKAAIYFDEAYKLIDYFPYDLELKIFYKEYADVNKIRGDFKSALKFYELHTEMSDSLFKIENKRAFAEKEAKYQNEKKQKQIQELKHQQKLDDIKNEEAKARSRMILIFTLVGLALLGVVIIVLIRSNRLKQHTNKLLQTQNAKISHQKEVIEEKNKDITDSINYAQNIQQAILPDLATAKSILGDSFILFQPRDIVSGDFYWMHRMENGDVFFAVADCTGHGVPGAFMSMMGNDMLNKIIIDHGISDPGKALSELNNEVKKALAKNVSADKMRDGMDITICKLTKERNKIFFSSAMRSVYHISGDTLNELKGDKNAIGGNTEFNFEFETHELLVNKNDSLFLTTDGYADQFGGLDGKKFMAKNLKEIFLSFKDKSMDEQYSVLKDSFFKWKGKFEQIDDVTVMGIRI